MNLILHVDGYYIDIFEYEYAKFNARISFWGGGDYLCLLLLNSLFLQIVNYPDLINFDQEIL